MEVYYFLKNNINDYVKEYDGKTGDKRKMLWNLFRYGCCYDEYFLFDIRNQKHGARDFITDIGRIPCNRKLNKRENQIDFDDKARTYEIFGEYYKRNLVKITCREDFDAWCAAHKEFILKPLDAGLGRGVRLIKLGETEESERGAACGEGAGNGEGAAGAGSVETIDSVWKKTCKVLPFIVEEKIVQSSDMAAFQPESVNTIRINLILTGDMDGACEICNYYPLLRTGQGGSVVDNASAGGILCQIDEDGIVSTEGRDKLGRAFTEHPDTHVTFKGFKLPDWEQAIDICEKAALSYGKNRYMSFDLAHTDEFGWVIVEINARGQFTGTQLFDKIGKKKELEEICAKVK